MIQKSTGSNEFESRVLNGWTRLATPELLLNLEHHKQNKNQLLHARVHGNIIHNR